MPIGYFQRKKQNPIPEPFSSSIVVVGVVVSSGINFMALTGDPRVCDTGGGGTGNVMTPHRFGHCPGDGMIHRLGFDWHEATINFGKPVHLSQKSNDDNGFHIAYEKPIFGNVINQMT